MKLLIEFIGSEIDNPKTVFVFPSEAAAEFWRRESLVITGKSAVRDDRFLSWDSFKEKITKHDRPEKPVNAVIRRLFAADIVRRNSSSPVFSVLIPAEYSGQSGAFADSLLRMLPELQSLMTRMAEAGPDEQFPVSDLKLLYDEYCGFMRKNSLFEPSWEIPDLKEPEHDYIVVFPGLIEDWDEYSARLVQAGCRTFVNTEKGAGELLLYENSAIEADSLLNRLADLIAAGAGPSSIVVSSADENVTAILFSKAALRGISLQPRSGRPLSEYPAGRLPSLVRECRQSGYSLASLKNLLLFRAFNWKESGTAAALVRFGIENRCLKNTASSIYGDVWAKRLKAAGEAGLLAFYRRLRSRIEALAACGTFAELSSEFQLFISTFLDTDVETWDAECEKVFQRSREVLSGLKDAEASLVDTENPDPLGLWIEVLKEKIYVQRQKAPGIAVYPYRVSAGMMPEHHFIIGMSHECSNVVSKSFTFLSEQQRKAVGAEEKNMTEAFLDVYAASGKSVCFSAASDTPGGTALPPARFIEEASVVRITGDQPEFSADPYYAELRWWESALSGRPSPAFSPAPVQAEGFLYAEDVLMRPAETDLSGEAFPAGEVFDALLENRCDDEGLLRISASALNRWSACPFLYLLNDLLGIGEDEYILNPEDPMTAGNIMHEILHDFFGDLKAEDRAFSSADADEYRSRLREKTNGVFARWEKEENYFFGPAWDALKRRVRTDLSRFPEAESSFYDGLKPVLLESWLDFILGEERIRAGGFVDRISQGDGRAVVVDYKKSWSKISRKKYISRDEDGKLMTPEPGFQLPFYLLLAQAAGIEDAEASYYSISSAEHFPVSGPGGVLDDEDVGNLLELTLERIREMAEAVRSGNFMAPRHCDGCGMRSVCRKRYNIRWAL